MKIYASLSAAQADLAKLGVAKTQRNAKQGYNFRGIDDMYNAVAPILASHGVVIVPTYSDRSVTERKSAQGGVLFHVVLRGEFAFVAVDGSKVVVVTYGEAMDSADKATNKAMSAALKYALIQTLLIPTEGDNDADASHPEVARQNVAHHEAERLSAPRSAQASRSERNPYPESKFEEMAPRWMELIAAGKTTPETIIAKLESMYVITDKQRSLIEAMRQDVSSSNRSDDVSDLPVF